MKHTRNLQNDARHALNALRAKKERERAMHPFEEAILHSMNERYEMLKHSPMGDLLTRD